MVDSVMLQQVFMSVEPADLTFVNGGYYVEQGTLRGVVVTGTQSISRVNTSDNPSAIYSLDGRRVSQPKPGIYIRNNKKVVIR